MKDNEKPRILITEDSEMNRSSLLDILGEEYELVEAENGATKQYTIQVNRLTSGTPSDSVALDSLVSDAGPEILPDRYACV